VDFINENAQGNKEEAVQELNKNKVNLGTCGIKDKNICIISIIESKDLTKAKIILQAIKDKY